MKKFVIAAMLLLAFAAPAPAQLGNLLSGAGGGQSGGGLGGLGGGSGLSGLGGAGLPSLGATNPTNLAGVLQYCVQNNYLGGAGTADPATVQQSLLSKFTGSSSDPTSNSSFSSGASGMLNTGNGQNVALGGSGLKAQLTQKLCAQVLQHSQSLL